MSSPSATAPPMSFCHECGIEIRPLLTSHPTCPRCNGGFVEEIGPNTALQDDDEDEEVMGHPLLGGNVFNSNTNDAAGGGDEMDFMSMIQAIAQGYHGTAPTRQQRDDQTNQPQTEGDGSGGNQGGNTRGQPGLRTGTARIGPINVAWGMGTGGTAMATRMGGGGSRQETVSSPPGLNEYLQRSFGPHVHDDGMGGAGGASDGRFFNADNQRGDSEGNHHDDGEAGRQGQQQSDSNDGLPPELASIRQVFSNLFGGLGNGPATLLADFLGGGGRSGDYVFGQQGLDDVISQLMEQTRGSTAPPPATKEAIAKLERFTRFDKDKVAQARNRECPTCMDDFEEVEEENDNKGEGNSDGAQTQTQMDEDPPEAVPDEIKGQQDEVVMMPCKHLFHQDCLIPWLETSATCPVCRITLETASPSSGSVSAPASTSAPQAGPAAPQTTSSSSPSHTVEGPSADMQEVSGGVPMSMRERTLQAAERRQRADQGQDNSNDATRTMPGALEPDELD